MLLDEVTLKIKAGDGGTGVVRWRHEKGIAKGGPAGGDGGKGGDVYFMAVRDVHALSNYKRKRDFKAENGEAGGSKSLHGKNGEDLILELPLGSVVHNNEYDIDYEFTKEGERVLILNGGTGGRGNEYFKSSTNRSPQEAEPGTHGESATFSVELRLIADAGLIGFPNAGKSSLLNALTSAHSKVGDYPFTTLEPNLGEMYGYILADIPGLIEGASEGRGLGHKFLRHVQRTKLLVHLVSADNERVADTYKAVRTELKRFNPELVDKEELVVLTKSDMVDGKILAKKKKELEKASDGEVTTISLYDDSDVKAFMELLLAILQGKKTINKKVSKVHAAKKTVKKTTVKRVTAKNTKKK